MQFKYLASILPLLAVSYAAPTAESKSTAADLAARTELDKTSDDVWLWKRDEDSDDVWLWKREPTEKRDKDADDVWLWKRDEGSDDVWLWRRDEDSDDVWLWKKGEEANKQRVKLVKESATDVKKRSEASPKLVKDADDVWLW